MWSSRRLILGFFAVIAILLAAGALIITRTIADAEQRIAENAETMAAELLEEINLAIDNQILTIHAVAATRTDLHAALAASNRDFAARGDEAQIRAQIEQEDQAWRAAPAGTPTALMRSIMAGTLSQELHRTMEFHKDVEGRPVFAEIFVTNRYGANAGQTGRTSDFRQDDEGWWQAAWRDGRWVADEVSLDHSAGVYAIEIGMRVENADRERLGVMKAVLNVDAVRSIVDRFSRNLELDGVIVELVDGRGRVIHRLDDPEAFQKDLTGQEIVQRALAGARGHAVELMSGVEMLRAYVGSRRPGSMRLGLVLNVPTASMYAGLEQQRSWMIGIGLLGALLAALVGLLLSTAFARVTGRLEAVGSELAANEARMRSIVTTAVDGIVTIDSRGVIQSTNPAVEAIFGYARDEMRGQNVKMLMPEPYRSEHDGYLERYVRTREPRVIGVRSELFGRRKDGTDFPLELGLSEVERPDGDSRFVGILRDVSERHEAQQALEEAKNEAEMASRTKGQFLANMSHELRTPLNAVIGYSEMIGEELEERGESELVDDSRKIRTAGKHLLDLINAVLDVSKIEAGKVDLFLETFDVAEMLYGVAATVRPLMERRSNELVLELAPNLGTTHSDLTKTRQILFNLLSNAAKFTQSGTVTLRARREAGDGQDWFLLAVDDTGIGMDEEQRARVWDAFAQADASTTREFGGTGLGLTITKSFCELLGGRIDVQSTPGKGSTFECRLPARSAPAMPTAAPRSLRQDGSSECVLIIDDDEASREIVERVLRQEGYEVLGAASGPEGLRIASEIHPAAIVLDVMMPGMDGWSVLKTLREDEALADTPVVMLSMADESELGLALGADAYLSKPLDRTELSRALQPFHVEPTQRRVLVVEDEHATRELVARTLTRDGWRVELAENGEQALEVMAERPPDLMLVDLMMPVMNGFELLTRVRADERFADLPVIVLTAKDLTPDEGAHLKGMVQRTMQKGASSGQDLRREVRRLVRSTVAQEHRKRVTP